jgi:4-amino-4-deoxychorismate lyase
VLKLLPKSILGATSNDSSQAYILEKSVVDVNEGWMETESQNLEWTSVLSVIERQVYRRPLGLAPATGEDNASSSPLTPKTWDFPQDERTDVTTTVTFHSRLGQSRFLHHRKPTLSDPDPPPRKSLFQSWSTSSIQRSIELIGVRRTRDQLIKSKEGMKIVLERLREGGLVGVLEGMRRDRERPSAFAGSGGHVRDGGTWKRVWKNGRGEQGQQHATADDHRD